MNKQLSWNIDMLNKYSTTELITLIRQALEESHIDYTIDKQGKIDFDGLPKEMQLRMDEENDE